MHWSDFDPQNMINIVLPWDGPHGLIEGPMNELGERCPWPWEPQQLKGAPMGQYHCSYCGGMNVAGVAHIEWTQEDIDEMTQGVSHEEPSVEDWTWHSDRTWRSGFEEKREA